jgi:hypothetical protein
MFKLIKSFFTPTSTASTRHKYIQTLQTIRAEGKLDYIIAEGPMDLYNYLINQFDEDDIFAEDIAKQLTSQFSGFGIIPLRNIGGSIEKYVFVADKKILLSLDSKERKQMIAHELGHVLDFENSSEDIVQSYLTGSQDILEYEIRAWKKADELLSEGVNWNFAEECLDSYRRVLKQTPKTNSKRLSLVAADVFERYMQIYVLTAESEEEKLTMQKRIRAAVKQVRQLHGLI